ncbi:hypothetical protein [Paenarthrobacter sp. C1]|uniref:hypothetical protein n=1 Tax=Paenarthrobacter sp. C1 TaxID=3400220 RepID=UPI003BF555E6
MPTDSLYFDRDGEPIDLDRFVELSSDEEYRRLKTDQREELTVATVWMGLDQGLFADAEGPQIFGTAIYDNDARDLWNGFERFAATEEEAYANHAAALEVVATR